MGLVFVVESKDRVLPLRILVMVADLKTIFSSIGLLSYCNQQDKTHEMPFKVYVNTYLLCTYVMSCVFIYIFKEPLDKDIDEETDENLISFVTEGVTEGFTETTTHAATTLSKCW